MYRPVCSQARSTRGNLLTIRYCKLASPGRRIDSALDGCRIWSETLLGGCTSLVVAAEGKVSKRMCLASQPYSDSAITMFPGDE
jgi:hypothetical protein